MSESAVDMDAVLKEADIIREEASELLQFLGILDYLNSYGSVRIVGSYFLNMMLNRDIDINIITPGITLDQALLVLTGCIRQGSYYGATFYDSVNHSLPWDAPAGYYLELCTHFKGSPWTIELWFKTLEEPSPDWMTNLHTDEQRRAILRLKYLRNRGGLEIPSYDIYKAVLLDQITDSTIVLGQ